MNTLFENEFDILKDIFSYLFANSKNNKSLRKISTDRKPHIKKKIEINFNDNQPFVKQTYTNNLASINLVKRFFEDQNKISEEPILDLIDRIQSLYLQFREAADVNVPINDFKHFDQIAEALIKPYGLSSPTYITQAKAIVLYVFEMCDIGKLPEQDSSIKLPKRQTDPNFFDEI